MDSKVIIGRFPVIDLASKGVPGNFTCPGPAQLQARPCGVFLGCSSTRQNEDFCSEFSAKVVHIVSYNCISESLYLGKTFFLKSG